MCHFCREVDLNLRLRFNKLVECALSSGNTGFLCLVFRDELHIILNLYRPFADIVRESVLEQHDLICSVLSVIPEAPVIAVRRPLPGACRHDE